MLPVPEQKKKLRAHFRALRASVSGACKQDLDTALIEHILKSPLYRNAQAILLYYPIGSEPNLLPLAEDAWRHGKKVGFPISHKETKALTFHTVTDLSSMKEGAYGIHEPSPTGEILNDAPACLCLVPALAVDQKGHRLGYGGGYYDRFLANFSGEHLAPVYSILLTDALPTDPNDRAVTRIITEKGEESPHVSATQS